MTTLLHSVNQPVRLPLLAQKQVTLFLKREDLLHPFISGNKYRKLKYNVLEAQGQGHETLLTFGGAFSNHILATAFAASERGLKSIGVIRGDELEHAWQGNPTLAKAHSYGMVFKFVSREIYRAKTEVSFLALLQEQFGRFYVVPEGGTNALAVKGCEEILIEADAGFDLICTCVGTGGTVAGLINSSFEQQHVLGFSALKGTFLQADVQKLSTNDRWRLMTDYHFGGYAKVTCELVEFINAFKQQTRIPLDPIYTGKMMFGLLDMVKRDTFAPGTKLLAIHTGGLQGIDGMNSVLKKKNLPLLQR